MTTLRHHPHDETLMSYSAGTLDPAMSLVLSCHLQFCDTCRANLRRMDEIGGALLENIPLPDEDTAFFERTMRRFSEQVAQEVGSVTWHTHLDAGNEVIMPGPLARETGLRRETIPWNFDAAGLRRFDLPAIGDAKATAHIINIAPGAVLSPEKNGGQLILVLWGAYDHAGNHFERGDLHDIAAGSLKAFKGEGPEGATFLTAISPVHQVEFLRTAH